MYRHEITVTRYTQLEDNLKGLRRDSAKLEAIVTKYERIHDEGPGRRLLFALKESSDLTDLRRRIGLHEQMLQIWYMTLVYGSLRRLEGGQEDILKATLKAIEAIKNWSPGKIQQVRQSLHRGDIKPLERELSKSGLKPHAVDAALDTAVNYVDAPPLERVRMESHARSSATIGPEGSSLRPNSFSASPRFNHDNSYERVGKGPKNPPSPPLMDMFRRNSNRSRRPHYDDFDVIERHYGKNDWYENPDGTDDLSESLDGMRLSDERLSKLEREREREGSNRRDRNIERKDAHRDERKDAKPKVEHLRKKEKKYPSHNKDIDIIPADSRRPRRSSDTTKPPPRNSLLVVPDTGPRYRPASYHGPSDRHERHIFDADGRDVEEQIIVVKDPPRRHRSSSRHLNRSDRDSSTHSYVRLRSSSEGQQGEDTVGRRRMITKMDRIDSIPL